MKGNLLTHLLAFALGITASYIVFSYTTNTTTQENKDETMILSESLDTEDSPMEKTNNFQDYQQLIDDKNSQIAQLKRQLSTISKAPSTVMQSDKGDDQKDQLAESNKNNSRLKKMTFEDFEDSMKESFTDRFKGVVIELSGEKLDDIKQAFSQSDETNEKSVQYENSISNFLAENNSDGDHFIQSLRCNTHICRLEVNTNNNDSWNVVYGSLTQQSWYESITIQEASEYPGNIIYYLPNMNN